MKEAITNLCEGCMYRNGIRMNDAHEYLGCGHCCQTTFIKNLQTGKCIFRKPNWYTPSEFEIERKAAALLWIKQRDALALFRKSAFEQETRPLVSLKTTRAAGTHFVKDRSSFRGVEDYDRIELVRECDNRYDSHAVSLYFRGKSIGYVPRTENREIAAMLEAGMHHQIVAYATNVKHTMDHVYFDINIYLKPQISPILNNS